MCSPSWSPLPPPSPSHPYGSSQCPSPEHLSHASNLGWWSVSHLIIYMFQCYSLRSSHPRLLPQSPKVGSIHLCLFFCPAYRVIITIFLNSIYMHWVSEWVKSLNHVRLFATPWTVTYQVPLSMEFSRQKYQSGLPFPSPGDLPDPGIKPGSPALRADALPSEPPGKPIYALVYCIGVYLSGLLHSV